jgi:hypothetical protein
MAEDAPPAVQPPPSDPAADATASEGADPGGADSGRRSRLRGIGAAVRGRVLGLDLREFVVLVIGIFGTVVGVVQVLDVALLATVAVTLVEVILITGLVLILPPQPDPGTGSRLTTATVVTALVAAGMAIAIPVVVNAWFSVPRSDPPGPSPEMLVRHYNPFVPGGRIRPGLTVEERDGSCWNGSLKALRDDAWRCVSGDYIYDPCFSYTGKDSVVACANDPWTSSVTRLRLTEPMPYDFANTNDDKSSWALILESGDRCVLSSGATITVAGQRADYTCDQGSVVFEFDPAAGRAQVLQPGAISLGSQRVLVAWS